MFKDKIFAAYMSITNIGDYVEQFGALIDSPENVDKVEELLLSVPDSKTFEKIRLRFYQRFKLPLLPAFLHQLAPEQHVRILKAYQVACRDYQ